MAGVTVIEIIAAGTADFSVPDPAAVRPLANTPVAIACQAVK